MPIRPLLPEWIQPWLEIITLSLQIILILLTAWLLNTIVRRIARRLGSLYQLPSELLFAVHRLGAFIISASALLMVLDRLGVSGTVLWTAFTGFAAVAAVAFFAAWSVLSNIFCAVLIFTTRPFRLHDYVEVIENGEKAGFKGQVVDINLIYTSLQESADDGSESVLHVPNSLFFQRATRRWKKLPQGGLSRSSLPAPEPADRDARAPQR